jgi:hypothetical protein
VSVSMAASPERPRPWRHRGAAILAALGCPARRGQTDELRDDPPHLAIWFRGGEGLPCLVSTEAASMAERRHREGQSRGVGKGVRPLAALGPPGPKSRRRVGVVHREPSQWPIDRLSASTVDRPPWTKAQ